LRIGREIFFPGERVRKYRRAIYLAAKFASVFLRSYHENEFSFSSAEREFFIDSRKRWPAVMNDYEMALVRTAYRDNFDEVIPYPIVR